MFTLRNIDAVRRESASGVSEEREEPPAQREQLLFGRFGKTRSVKTGRDVRFGSRSDSVTRPNPVFLVRFREAASD